MKKPKTLWIILDQLDGHHVYTSKRAAFSDLAGWSRRANAGPADPYWFMIGPLEYVLKQKRKSK